MSKNGSRRTQKLLPEQDEPAHRRREDASIALSNAAIAEQCLLELGAYRRGEPCDQTYRLELFRRATVGGDPEAWEQEWNDVQEIYRMRCNILDWLMRNADQIRRLLDCECHV